MIPTKFALTAADRQNPVWLKVKGQYETRLQELRMKNDGQADAIATATMRGRIAEVKALLDLELDEVMQSAASESPDTVNQI